MEIHSSSLNGIHTEYHSKNTDKDRFANKTETKENTKKTNSILLAPVNTIKEISNISDFNQLTESIEQENKTRVNSHAARALKAYAEENIQQLKSQRSELISRIDFFT